MKINEVQQRLGEKFVFAEKAIACMFYAHELANAGYLGNVILTGPKGHAKSELAKAFVDVMGYTPNEIFKAQFSVATKPEHLFGIPNMEKFMTGELEYNIENSFLRRKVAIFEELFNAPSSTLQMLIDILMSGEFCAGGKVCYKSACLFHISLTNVDPQAWVNSQDAVRKDSFDAFSARFPFQCRVDWNHVGYTARSYAALIEKVLKVESDAFCEMMEHAAKVNNLITPRTAVLAARSYLLNGVDSMQFIEGVTPDVYEEWRKIDGRKEKIEHTMKWLDKAEKLAKGATKFTPKELREAIDELNRYPVDPDNRSLNGRIEEVNTTLASRLKKIEEEHLNRTLYGSN